jgi:SAM-dependent methyltransferase
MKKENNRSLLKNRDLIKYWDGYYNKNNSNEKNSTFAEYCLPLIKNKSNLLELGCGNARDAYFFAKNGINVVALDISGIVIRKNLINTPADLKEKIKFVNKDFTLLNQDDSIGLFSSIYSRFTIHTMLKNKIDNVFSFCYDSLLQDGLLLIETRSIKDPLFSSGQGDKIAENTFQYEKGHIRHFISKKDFVDKLTTVGFELVEVTESDNLSIVGKDNPVLLRTIAKK